MRAHAHAAPCASQLPLVCGSCCACDGRRCCTCTGNRALVALLCQVLGWFAFGVFIANMAEAAAWQAAVSCGCTRADAGGAPGSSAAANGASPRAGLFRATSSSSDYAVGTACGEAAPELLSRLFITTFGALGMFASSMSLGCAPPATPAPLGMPLAYVRAYVFSSVC
jgi:hypothetical protein